MVLASTQLTTLASLRLIQKVVVDLVVTEELREPGFNLRQMS